MKKYAAIGHPISQSKSPDIFNEAFKSLEIDSFFEKKDVSPEDLELFIKTNCQSGEYTGLSVTIPHKENIIPFLDQISEDSKSIGAVNTVYFTKNSSRTSENYESFGENTDWYGITEVLKVVPEIETKKVLLLGAGGAGHACAYALKKMNILNVSIWNIDSEKSKSLADKFGYQTTENINVEADLIINATSVGLNPGEVLPISQGQFAKAGWVFDIVYAKDKTDFLRIADINGCHTIDGREMLLEQAYKQFEIFTGKPAPSEVMRNVLFPRD